MAKDETSRDAESSQFELLVESLLDGQISAQGEVELAKQLRADASRVKLLAEILLSEQALAGAFLLNTAHADSDWIAAVEDAMLMSSLVDQALELKRIHEIEEKANQLLAAQQADERSRLRFRGRQATGFEASPRNAVVIPKSIVAAAIAAALLLAVWIGWKPAPPPVQQVANPPSVADNLPRESTIDEPPPPPASLLGSHRAVWSAGSGAVGPQGGMPAGAYEIDTGYLQVKMLNGTDVLVEGPAKITIDSASQVTLTHGVLTAHIGPEVDRFVVETRDGRITDLGTEFGVIAKIDALDETTDVHVMQGEVELALAETNQTQNLRGGSAARLNTHEGRVTPIAMQGERFLREWADVVYTPSTAGAIQYLYAAPPSLAISQLESTQAIFLIPERMGMDLSRDIPCEITGPGEFGQTELETTSLESGIKVDSYLLHFDCEGRPDRLVGAEGVIEFDRPILGVILTDGSLLETDAFLGAPHTTYPIHLRGVEFQDTNTKGWDLIVLSEDRKTLSVNLTTTSHIDQIRVLVQAYTD